MIVSPAYGCGLYGYHPQVQPPPSPWIPLIVFFVVLFGVMFAGRSLPKMSQGVIIGFLFILGSGLGVFSFSRHFFPEAFVTMLVLIGVVFCTVLLLLGFRNRKDLWGIAKYGLGLFIASMIYLPIADHVPVIDQDPTFGWILDTSSKTKTDGDQLAARNSSQPTFGSSAKNISEKARLRTQNKVREWE